MNRSSHLCNKAPRFDGAILSQEWKEAVWDKFVMGARQDYARRQSSNTAIASFARAAELGIGHQPQDGGEVAQARDS